jgi:hypothetical protein
MSFYRFDNLKRKFMNLFYIFKYFCSKLLIILNNMKKKNRLVLVVAALFQLVSLSVFSQGDTIRLGRSTGLQVSGFARIDYVYDSRQTSEAVEGLFTFFPLNKQLDANGKDMNAAPVTNFVSIASRLCTRFFGPDVLGAKSSAYIEFDFTGTSNTNGVRMRQAYTNLAWKETNLLLGRTWHPFAMGCVPNVVALNTGAPFWSFNRSDQIRFDYKPGNLLLSLFGVFQSDYASLGPVPGTASTSVKSTSYMRNALWPEFAIHLAYKSPSLQFGTIGTVKAIKPRMYTMTDYANPAGLKYKTDEKLTSFAAQAYIQYQNADWILKAQASYTQNTTESLMMGGYAVSAIDFVTGHEQYTPTQHLNYWINVDYGKKWQVGLFAGYLNSLGTLKNVAGPMYARGGDIKYMYRLSPHLFYTVNNWQFGAEIEYTAAAYGEIQNNQKAKIINTSEVANNRANLLVYFFF